jgi:hypothetical protein
METRASTKRKTSCLQSYELISNVWVPDLTVAQLKSRLTTLGLPAKGNRAKLASNLSTAVRVLHDVNNHNKQLRLKSSQASPPLVMGLAKLPTSLLLLLAEFLDFSQCGTLATCSTYLREYLSACVLGPPSGIFSRTTLRMNVQSAEQIRQFARAASRFRALKLLQLYGSRLPLSVILTSCTAALNHLQRISICLESRFSARLLAVFASCQNLRSLTLWGLVDDDPSF